MSQNGYHADYDAGIYDAGIYDALIVVSFGGPEGMDDVMPFLENVLRGRNVPRERMVAVAHHYELFGGISPINGQNRALIDALENELAEHGPHLPIYWGNRNWQPFMIDTLRQMANDGVKKALAFFTSAYSSYSGCRQYRENIAEATEALAAEGIQAPEIHLLRKFYNHPGFIKANVEHVRAALAQIPAERRSETQIVFTAHSIPLGMAQNSMYATHFSETSRLVAEGIGHARWQQAYQSRSGSPQQPWLEPDILDALRELKAEGVQDVVIAPVGFISDHMEVLYDLDTEARQLSDEIGLYMVRAATAGVNPAFVSMIRELIVERIEVEAGGHPTRHVLGKFGASHDVCPVNCCLPAQRLTPAQTAPTTTATHS